MSPPGADQPTLRDQLVSRIRERGPLSFSEYVEAALYEPARGFFARGRGAGRRADFLTSAEVGPLFGAVVARALDRWWDSAGRPDPFHFVDCGAGAGTLARSLLAAHPECAAVLRVVLVERAVALHPRHPTGAHLETRIDLPAGPIDGVVFANELLDNLPFDLHHDGREVRIDADARGRLVFDDEARTGLWADHTHAARWLDSALAILRRGRVVAIDYMTTTAAMRSREWPSWLRTYRAHGRGGHPLEHPGSQDITVEVALDQLTARHRPVADSAQRDFLHAHGIEELVEEGRRLWVERAAVADLAAVAGRSRVREAEALCDPSGLGAFRVVEWPV